VGARVSINSLLTERLPSRFERRKPHDPLTRRDESLAFDAEWRPPEWFSTISIVLVEPQHPVNIGGVVRAMANTGFTNLRLVNPTQFDEWQIIGIAHYTQHIIRAAQRFESLPGAVADTQLVIGLTGKHHREKRNELLLSAAVAQVVEAAQSGQRVGIVFGREDWGLSNDMLDACHFVTTIPTNPAHPSLNLAQAALLVLYQLFVSAGGEQQEYRPPRKRSTVADTAMLEDLFADLQRALEAIGFLEERSTRSVMRSLRVAFFRARLDAREAGLMRAIALEIRHFLRRRGVLSEVGEIGARRRADLTPPAEAGILRHGPHEPANVVREDEGPESGDQ
jgi:TrmH family RNA methyltransferase